MAKDPAFLFYSKDFYEGTRMMLPEERACYVDLLIYQHQNGIIPNDLSRVVMYCSGVSKETVSQVLNQKFNQTVNGWLNQRLSKEQDLRCERQPKKVASATLAGLISSSKIGKREKTAIKNAFKIEDFIYDNNLIIKDLELIKTSINGWFKNMVNQMVNNKANVNANAIVNKDEEDKGGVGEKEKTPIYGTKEIETPTLEQTIAHFKFLGVHSKDLKPIAEKFFLHYESTGWKLPNNSFITNWKARAQVWLNENKNRKSNETGKQHTGNIKKGPPEPAKGGAFWQEK